MKKQVFSWVLMAFVLLVGFASCEDEVSTTVTYEAYEPIYMSRAELEASVNVSEAKPLEQLGKIYSMGQYIYINEPGKGVHVVDNLDPLNPVNVSFIAIPGNYDISILNNLLYADNATDLVVLDISDVQNPRLVERVANVFNEVYPEGLIYSVNVAYEEGDVLVGWNKTTVEEKIEPNGNVVYWRGGILVGVEMMDYSSSQIAAPMAKTGVSGSLARFKIYANYLYTLEQYQLGVFDISHPTQPELLDKIGTSWLSETLFIKGNELFVGTRDGMIIYSLAQPEAPQYLSSIQHWRSCVPVVVEDQNAFITLRSGGSTCGGTTNELQVINISDLNTPKLLASYPMYGPYGLGISNHTLFVCDGDAGLKVYDASDVMKIADNPIQFFPEINALDVIPLNDHLMMIGKDGLYQYDFSDLKHIELLSYIPVGKN